MINNQLTKHDVKTIKAALERIKDTLKTINEDACDKEYVKWSINSDIDDILFYASELRKDIER